MNQHIIKIAEPETYVLSVKIVNNKNTYSLECPQKGKKFKGISVKPGPKIYMLIGKRNKMICYIGQTIQTMGKRFNGGFNARKKYDWALQSDKFYLLVWDVGAVVGSDSKSLDSLESELVFLTRIKQGMWPRYQTSIKFNYPRNTKIGFHLLPFAQSMMTHVFNVIKHLPENKTRATEIDTDWREFVKKNRALKF